MIIVKKNKLICLAVALATLCMVVTGCSTPQTDSKATGNLAEETYKSYILGEFIEADEGTVLLAQEKTKVQISGKTVSTEKFIIKDRFSAEYYSCPIAVKTKNISMQDGDVVVDIIFFTKDDICVPTPYGELHFSDEWADYLDVTVSEDKNIYTFIYDINGDSAPLFTVYFDGQGDTVVGHLDGGAATVGISIEDVNATDNDAVMAMAEGVNYLVENISLLDGFEAAD